MPQTQPSSRNDEVSDRFLAHPQRVASTISTFMELKVFADQIAADAFGTIRKWLGIHSRFLHDFHFGFQSCNELSGLSVIPKFLHVDSVMR